MSEDLHNVLSWPVERPIGVWFLAGFDALLWGVLPILVGLSSLLSAQQLDTAAVLGSQEAVSPFVRDIMEDMARGVYRGIVFEAVLNLVLGAATLIAAVGAWRGSDVARKVLLGVITLYGIRFVLQGGTEALVFLLIVGFHWWYFTQATTLYFYDHSGNADI